MMTKDQIGFRYQKVFGEKATYIVRSPGRINIIGEHTDYNEGFVLPTAIDKGVYVAVAKRDDDLVRLYAESFEELFEVKLSDVEALPEGWQNYVLGVVGELCERGYELGGFNLYLDGDIPVGAGLSSSAAVECATGFALNVLFDLAIDRIAIALIGQQAEHKYAGVQCGIMDQFASAMSRAGQVIKLDCRDLSFSYKPLELGDYTILLLNTNVNHSLASSAYNERRKSCERSVGLVQGKFQDVVSLRDVTLTMLEECVEGIDNEAYIKSKFVLEENQRVEKACEFLENGNLDMLGSLLYEAHTGLSNEYEVSCVELDFLVEYVKQFPEVLGARMMGGGFGGCTINLVHKSFEDLLIERLVPVYKERFGLSLTAIKVVPSNGTEVLL